MKKTKFFIANFKNLMSNQRGLFILYTLICMNIYGSKILSVNLSYIGSILEVFTSQFYVSVSFCLFFINSVNTLLIFDQNNFYIIRFKNRKHYLKKLLNSVMINNILVFLFQFGTLLLGLLLFNKNGIIIENIGNYDITNLLYTIFYIIRLVLLLQLFSIIGILIIKLTEKAYGIIYQSIMIWTIFYNPYQPFTSEISSISQMLILPGQYFGIHIYRNFSVELKLSIIYVLVLIVISLILFRITLKHMKQVGK